MPLISVIVPVYKVEPYLRRCVDSILAQTFTGFELIMVDDGSPDNCGAICDNYAAQDSRIHVIHQQNGGLSAARNAGIDWAFANSDSQWLSFVDSDDWVYPCFLEYLYRAVQETGAKVSACGIRKVEGEVELPDVRYHAESMSWDQFYLTDWVRGVVAVNKLYEKSLFSGLRYPVGRIHEDEYLTYRLLARAGTVAFIDAELYMYFQNPTGIMKSSFSLKRLDAIEAIKGQCAFAKEYGYAELYKRRCDALIGNLATMIVRCGAAENLAADEKKRGLQYLRAELRKLLFLERKAVVRRKEKLWYYELAYPKLMRYYWICVGIVGKIKRMVNRNA